MSLLTDAYLLGRKGLTFLPELKGLKPASFLTVEAISWILQNVDGVNSKEQAIQLCQVSGFVSLYCLVFKSRSAGENRRNQWWSVLWIIRCGFDEIANAFKWIFC